MFLLDWYQRWLEIREAHRIEKVCESCETLKSQLATVNHEKQLLLNRIMEKPEIVPERTIAPPMQNVGPRLHTPWRVRQQMLEAEDRAAARAKAAAAKPDNTPTDTEMKEFEAEVANAEATREKAKS